MIWYGNVVHLKSMLSQESLRILEQKLKGRKRTIENKSRFSHFGTVTAHLIFNNQDTMGLKKVLKEQLELNLTNHHLQISKKLSRL